MRVRRLDEYDEYRLEPRPSGRSSLNRKQRGTLWPPTSRSRWSRSLVLLRIRLSHSGAQGTSTAEAHLPPLIACSRRLLTPSTAITTACRSTGYTTDSRIPRSIRSLASSRKPPRRNRMSDRLLPVPEPRAYPRSRCSMRSTLAPLISANLRDQLRRREDLNLHRFRTTHVRGGWDTEFRLTANWMDHTSRCPTEGDELQAVPTGSHSGLDWELSRGLRPLPDDAHGPPPNDLAAHHQYGVVRSDPATTTRTCRHPHGGCRTSTSGWRPRYGTRLRGPPAQVSFQLRLGTCRESAKRYPRSSERVPCFVVGWIRRDIRTRTSRYRALSTLVTSARRPRTSSRRCQPDLLSAIKSVPQQLPPASCPRISEGLQRDAETSCTNPPSGTT
jgi:hypothetical protein